MIGASGDDNAPASTSVENAPRVETISVEPRDLVQKIELPGTVEGYETADLYAKIGGFLAEINVDIGDHVEKGEVLARLSIPELDKELQQKKAAVVAAQAEAERSQSGILQAEARVQEKQTLAVEKRAQLEFHISEYDRVKSLVDRGSLNGQLYDEARLRREAADAALQAAQSAIRTAEADLDKAKTDYRSALAHIDLAQADQQRVEALVSYGVIRAPFDGLVTKRFVDPGAFIQPADGNSAARPLLTVSRIDLVRIWLDLPMAEVRWLDRQDRVLFDRINVLPGAQFEGKVTRFATALDPSSRMMRVEVDLENPNHQLLPGYYGYVTVYLDEMPQTPVVPSSSLFQSGADTCVYVIENGMCRKRPVTSCYQDGAIVGIASGLDAGEEVVQAGAGQLRDGQQVVAVNADTIRVASE